MRDGQPSKLRLGLFLASLAGGGLEKTMLTLAAGLADRGHSVTLLPCRRKGRLADKLPPGLKVHELARRSALLGRLAALWADPSAALPLLRPFLLSRKPPESDTLPAGADGLAAARAAGWPDRLHAAGEPGGADGARPRRHADPRAADRAQHPVRDGAARALDQLPGLAAIDRPCLPAGRCGGRRVDRRGRRSGRDHGPAAPPDRGDPQPRRATGRRRLGGRTT